MPHVREASVRIETALTGGQAASRAEIGAAAVEAAERQGTSRDVGTAYSGLLILNCEMGDTSDVTNVGLYTSATTSTITTSHTKVHIEQVKYWTSAAPTGPGTAITVSSEQFTLPADSADLLVVAQVSGLMRYVGLCMACASGSTSAHQIGAVLLADSSPEAPIQAARGAY